MPTFDFQCGNCNAIFEFARPFGSTQNPKCPQCKSKQTQKLIAPPVIHFKGAGFYKTDSGVKSKKNEGNEAKEAKDSKDKIETVIKNKSVKNSSES